MMCCIESDVRVLVDGNRQLKQATLDSRFYHRIRTPAESSEWRRQRYHDDQSHILRHLGAFQVQRTEMIRTFRADGSVDRS